MTFEPTLADIIDQAIESLSPVQYACLEWQALTPKNVRCSQKELLEKYGINRGEFQRNVTSATATFRKLIEAAGVAV